MEPEWLSYQVVADRLGITPEAARSRAKRLGWRRQTGNDGRALVLVALEPRLRRARWRFRGRLGTSATPSSLIRCPLTRTCAPNQARLSC
jgi:hypothetical protein